MSWKISSTKTGSLQGKLFMKLLITCNWIRTLFWISIMDTWKVVLKHKERKLHVFCLASFEIIVTNLVINLITTSKWTEKIQLTLIGSSFFGATSVAANVFPLVVSNWSVYVLGSPCNIGALTNVLCEGETLVNLLMSLPL